MLDAKDIKIINLISFDEEWININDLITKLEFSRGDFYYHLEHLNLFFKNNKIPQLNLKMNNKDEIKIIINKWQKIDITNNFFFNEEQRSMILIVLLVIFQPLKLEQIKKYFSISINTAFSDIQNCIYFLKKNFGSEIKIINKNKKGYFYLANELAIRKLIVNVSIILANFDNFILICNFFIHSLSEKNIDYAELKKIVTKHYSTLSFINMEPKTITFIIYILLCRDQSKILFPKMMFKTTNQEFYKNQPCYFVARNLMEDLKKIYEFNNEEIELFYFAIFFSSSYQFITSEMKISEVIQIKYHLKILFKHLELEGYRLNISPLMVKLINYIYWHSNLLDLNLIFDYSNKIKQKIFINNHLYQQFYLDLRKVIENINNNIFDISSNSNYFEFALQFLPYILKYPIKKTKKSILITNNKGGTINVLILKITELFPDIEIINVINWKYYEDNKWKYFHFWKLSDDQKIEYDQKGIFFNSKKFANLNIKNDNLIQKLMLIENTLANNLSESEKIMKIKSIIKNF